MNHKVASPARIGKQVHGTHLRLHLGRRTQTRRRSLGSTALQHQRRQAHSSFSNHDRGMTAPGNANINQLTNPDMASAFHSRNEAPLLSIPAQPVHVTQQVSTSDLDRTNEAYGPLLSHDNMAAVFDFQDPISLRDGSPNQCNEHGNMFAEFDNAMLPANAEISSDLSHDGSFQAYHYSTSTSTTADAPAIRRGATIEERLELVVQAVQNAGFQDMDDMILSYYTSSLDVESDVFQDQRMSRKRGLPVMLSELRESAAAWQEYERETYHAEILKNAESILVGECRRLYFSPAFREHLTGLQSTAMHSPPPSSCASSTVNNERLDTGMQDSMSDPGMWLSEELPNVWKLVSALSGCRAGSQLVASLLLTLCSARNLEADGMRSLCQRSPL